MKKTKKLLAAIAAMALMLSSMSAMSLSASAAESAALADVPTRIVSEFGVTGDNLDTIIPLYRADDSVIAYCLLFNGAGYVVYDLEGVVLQYSPTDSAPITAASPRVYYTGPSMFFYRSGDVYTHVLDSAVTVASDVMLADTAIQDVAEDRATNPVAMPRAYASNRTSYTPRSWKYNPTGICAGTAAATLLAYYDDHINGGTVPDLYMTSDGVSLTKVLANRIYNIPSGMSCAANNRDVFKWWFKNYSTGTAKNYSSTTSEGSWSTVYSFVKSNISRNRPLEVYFSGDNINHAVCVYGWEDNNGSSRIRCADGWGGTNTYFNAGFLYAGINISG